MKPAFAPIREVGILSNAPGLVVKFCHSTYFSLKLLKVRHPEIAYHSVYRIIRPALV
jgi:hypothetical protein